MKSPLATSLTRSLSWFALVSFMLTSCASSPELGHREEVQATLAQSAPGTSNARIETLVIAATNDLHGALLPLELKTKDDEARPYRKGGLAWLASALRQLRQEYGAKLLLFDAGDQVQGSIESNSLNGQPMTQFFNQIGVQAAALGNHEFDFGQETLKKRMGEAHFPYLAANLIDRKTGLPPDFPNLKAHTLIQAGPIRVGMIGLITQETPTTTIPTHVENLEFTDLVQATIREAKILREKGAQVIVALAHSPIRCELPANLRNQLRKPTDPAGNCDSDQEMTQFLKKLPRGTIDAAISGHSHTLVHHWINDVPVIQAGSRGHFLNLIYLPFDLESGKVLRSASRIEGPIPICPQVFANQNDCNGDRPAPKNGRGPLVTPLFLSQELIADEATEKLLAPAIEAAKEKKELKLAQAARPIEHATLAESELGNLVTDAMLEATQADFALANSGGLRASLGAGPITYGDLFQSIPFENSVEVISLTGRDLRKIMRIAQNGVRGFFPTAGLQVTVIDPKLPPRKSDQDGDGKISLWELDRLVSLKDRHGQPLADPRTYRLALVDFLLLGGDDLSHALKNMTYQAVRPKTNPPMLRTVVMDYLVRRQKEGMAINSPEKPLIDATQPRLVFSSTPTSEGRGARKRSRTHRAPRRK